MTPEQIEAIVRDIAETVKAGIDITAVFVPGSVMYLMLGKAIANAMPELAATVTSWIEGNPPTPQELDEFKKKLAALSDPNNP